MIYDIEEFEKDEKEIKKQREKAKELKILQSKKDEEINIQVLKFFETLTRYANYQENNEQHKKEPSFEENTERNYNNAKEEITNFIENCKDEDIKDIFDKFLTYDPDVLYLIIYSFLYHNSKSKKIDLKTYYKTFVEDKDKFEYELVNIKFLRTSNVKERDKLYNKLIKMKKEMKKHQQKVETPIEELENFIRDYINRNKITKADDINLNLKNLSKIKAEVNKVYGEKLSISEVEKIFNRVVKPSISVEDIQMVNDIITDSIEKLEEETSEFYNNEYFIKKIYNKIQKYPVREFNETVDKEVDSILIKIRDANISDKTIINMYENLKKVSKQIQLEAKEQNISSEIIMEQSDTLLNIISDKLEGKILNKYDAKYIISLLYNKVHQIESERLPKIVKDEIDDIIQIARDNDISSEAIDYLQNEAEDKEKVYEMQLLKKAPSNQKLKKSELQKIFKNIRQQKNKEKIDSRITSTYSLENQKNKEKMQNIIEIITRYNKDSSDIILQKLYYKELFGEEDNDKSLQKILDELKRNNFDIVDVINYFNEHEVDMNFYRNDNQYESFIKLLESIKNERQLEQIINKVNTYIITNEEIKGTKLEKMLINIIKYYDANTISEIVQWFQKSKLSFYDFYQKFIYVFEDIEDENIDEEEDEINKLDTKIKLKNRLFKLVKTARSLEITLDSNIPKNYSIEDLKNAALKLSKDIKDEELRLKSTFNYHLKLKQFLEEVLIIFNSNSVLNMREELKAKNVLYEDIYHEAIANEVNEESLKENLYTFLINQFAVKEYRNISSIIKKILDNDLLPNFLENEYVNQTFQDYNSSLLKEGKIKLDNVLVYAENDLICKYIVDTDKAIWNQEEQRFVSTNPHISLEEEDICGFIATTKDELNEHILTTHEIKEPKSISDAYYKKPNIYINRPWLRKRIIRTYICMIEGEDKENFNKYIINPNVTYVDTNDDIYYGVNESFYSLEENYKNKKQEGNILSIYNNNGVIQIQFKLGFMTIDTYHEPQMMMNQRVKEYTDKEFVIQDENIYKQEKEYLSSLTYYLNEYKINEILDSTVSETSLTVAKALLKRFINNLEDKYKVSCNLFDKDVIYKLLDDKQIQTLSNRELASKLSEIIIFADLEEVCDNTFAKRLVNDYYNLDKILNLSFREKIPEVFVNNKKYFTQIKHYIERQTNEFIYKFGEDIYIYSHSNIVKQLKRKRFEFHKLKLKYISIKSFCKIESSAHDLVIYYKSGEQKYCLNLRDLLEHIYNKTNFDYFPKLIDNVFLERIKNLYRVDILQKKEEEVKSDIDYKDINICQEEGCIQKAEYNWFGESLPKYCLEHRKVQFGVPMMYMKSKLNDFEYNLIPKLILDIVRLSNNEYSEEKLSELIYYNYVKKSKEEFIEEVFEEEEEEEEEEVEEEVDKQTLKENEMKQNIIELLEREPDIDMKLARQKLQIYDYKDIKLFETIFSSLVENKEMSDEEEEGSEFIEENDGEDDDGQDDEGIDDIVEEVDGKTMKNICEFCRKNRKNVTKTIMTKGKKNFQILKNICLECINEKDF